VIITYNTPCPQLTSKLFCCCFVFSFNHHTTIPYHFSYVPVPYAFITAKPNSIIEICHHLITVCPFCIFCVNSFGFSFECLHHIKQETLTIMSTKNPYNIRPSCHLIYCRSPELGVPLLSVQTSVCCLLPPAWIHQSMVYCLFISSLLM
jgi:hypothetical protein